MQVNNQNPKFLFILSRSVSRQPNRGERKKYPTSETDLLTKKKMKSEIVKNHFKEICGRWQHKSEAKMGET
jgi:hypothetical protein